jgi:hypothetical protein
MMHGLLAELGIDIPEGLERALLMARQVVDGETPVVPATAVTIIGSRTGNNVKVAGAGERNDVRSHKARTFGD